MMKKTIVLIAIVALSSVYAQNQVPEVEYLWAGLVRVGAGLAKTAIRVGRNPKNLQRARDAFGYVNDAIGIYNNIKKRKEEDLSDHVDAPSEEEELWRISHNLCMQINPMACGDEEVEMWGGLLKVGAHLARGAMRGAMRAGKGGKLLKRASSAYGYTNDAISIYNSFKKRKEMEDLSEEEEEEMWAGLVRAGIRAGISAAMRNRKELDEEEMWMKNSVQS